MNDDDKYNDAVSIDLVCKSINDDKYLDLVGLWVGLESISFLLLYLVLVKAGLLLCFFSLFSTVLGSGFGGQENQTNLASHVHTLWWCGSFAVLGMVTSLL